MKKICVIAGLTASGKTKTAVSLAKIWNAEIISADSVAVYKGFDIGSAKPTLKEQEGIKHHLIDILDYKETYSVARFQKEARNLIKDIHGRGKKVIVVGGTGLYIKALLNDYRFEEEISESYIREEDTTLLYAELKEKDEAASQAIHPNNRKRIIRALESFEYHQKPRSEINQTLKDTQIIGAHVFFLSGDREKIYQRINERVHKMVEAGLESEVRDFYDKDKEIFSYSSFQSIGYREFEAYFNQIMDINGVIERIQRNTRRFAKRQLTWFIHQQDNISIDIFEEDTLKILKDQLKT